MSRVWPPTIRSFQGFGLDVGQQDNVIRSSVDAGPQKVRRRFTAAVTKHSVPLEVNGEELGYFWTWFNDTLMSGALDFEWEDPVTDETVTLRFAATPKFVETFGADDPDERVYLATLQLEVMP